MVYVNQDELSGMGSSLVAVARILCPFPIWIIVALSITKVYLSHCIVLNSCPDIRDRLESSDIRFLKKKMQAKIVICM